MATKKSTAEQVKVAMAKVEAAKAAEAAKADAKVEKAPVKKAAAKKTTTTKTTKAAAEKKAAPAKATKTAAKKAPAKKTVKATQTVVIQACGYEVTTTDVTAKVVDIVGKKVKELNIYVKPEEGMVYYTADGEQGSVAL